MMTTLKQDKTIKKPSKLAEMLNIQIIKEDIDDSTKEKPKFVAQNGIDFLSLPVVS